MSNRRILGVILSALLLAALVGNPSSSTSQQESTLAQTGLVAGRNVNMVSGMTLPYGDPWLQRQNEPSIAVSTRNPLHLFAGANDYRTVDMPNTEGELPGNAANPLVATGDAWLGAFQSMDQGESWTSDLLPGYPQGGGGSPLYTYGYTAAADPVVRAGTNGIFYYAGIAFKRVSATQNGDSALFLARYIDNNNTDGTPPIKYVDNRIIDTVTQASGQFIDKPWIAVDVPNAANQTVPISASGVPAQTIAANNVYIAYTVFSGNANATPSTLKGKILFRMSEDNGATWSSAVEVSSGSDINQGAVIAVDPGSPKKLYVAWRRFQKGAQTNAIMMATSNNGGKKFQSANVISSITPFDQGSSTTTFRSNSYPSMACDDTGNIHVAWTARGYKSGTNDSRIVVSSSNNGNSWSAPKAVDNHSARGHQFMPSLVYTGGRLMMAWYDARNDASGNFSDYITETTSTTGARHTVDVRTAVASPGSSPTYGASIQVSRYLFALADSQQDPAKKEVRQIQFNPLNYPLFKGGSQPFHGDYVDLAPSPTFVLKNKKWQFNTDASTTPIYHVAWTDNRDVRPPWDNNWANYTPPISSQPGNFPSPSFDGCNTNDNRMGMRNQNIYTAAITNGITIGTPRNAKPISGLGTYSKGQIPRTFIVFVRNATGEVKSFRLAIANQPTGGTASFLEFQTLTSLDVSVAPNSEVARSVFVTSTSSTASVTVQVTEIFYPGGNAVTGGFSGSVVLNPDDSNPSIPSGDSLATIETFSPNIINPNIINPNIINPNIINWNYANPNIINPTVSNPNIINPNIINPNIINPNIINPNIINPNIINPNIINPNIINPNIINPNIINPNIINPNIINPNIINPNIINAADVVYEVENNGNTYSTYTVRTMTSASIPAGIDTQLFIYRIHYTPQTGGIGCSLKQEPHFELVASIPNPNIINPNIINPNIINPNIINPDIQNVTFYIGPGESALVDLRVIDPNPAQAKIMANGQAWSLANFLDKVDFAATSSTVDTVQVAQEVKTPSFAATELTIGTAAQLPDGKTGTPYSVALSASGPNGSSATYAWRLNSGDLPPGLTLSSSGLVSGTPVFVPGVVYPFTYHFVLQVSGTFDGQTLTDSEEFFLMIYNTPAPPPLSISTASPLPNAIVDAFYGQTLIAVGGTAPRSWSLVSGSLPPGLTFDTAGAISGIPTTAGSYSFTLQVADSSAPPQTASKAFSLTVIAYQGTRTISGTCYSLLGAGMPGVLMHGLPDEPITNAAGYYTATVPYGWSGVVTPFIVGSIFSPASRAYSSIATDQIAQDYNAVVGAPAKLAFGVQPSNSSINGTITPAVTVEIRDINGNKITTATNIVTIAVGTNPGSGTLTGTLSKAAVSGVATFSDLKISAAGTGYTLTAASPSLVSATSNAFNVSAAGPPAKLGFKVQPTNTAAGVSIAPAVTVEIQDANGNLVASATDAVTISIGANPGGGTLAGTLSKAAISGTATFNDLNINYIGVGYTLGASSGALTAAVSNSFDIYSGIDPSAQLITAGVYPGLVISDRDVWFKVNVAGGKDLRVATSNAVAQQIYNDLDIYLYDSAGRLLTLADSDKSSETVFLSNLPAGVYFIRIWGSFVTYTLTVETGDLSVGDITGRITNSLGNGVENALVYLYPVNDNSWTAIIAVAPVDSSGNYKISHAPGNYKLGIGFDDRVVIAPDIYVVGQYYSGTADFSLATTVAIQDGATNSGKDAVLENGAAISGQVTAVAGGAPISQVLVKAYNATGGYNSARTDNSGNYLIKHIRINNGVRTVQFDAQSAGNYMTEWYNDKTTQTAADPVAISPRVTTGNINAQLGGGGIISGRVTRSGGSGIANVSVNANDLSYNLIKSTTTNADGYYFLQGLPGGSYKIFFNPSSAGYFAPEWYNDKLNFNDANQVSATIGQNTQGIDAELADGGVISGRVTNGSGLGIQNINVWPSYLDGNFFGQGTRTNASGYYALPIAAGDYKLYFNTNLVPAYTVEWFDNKPSSSAADPIHVVAGATNTADAVLTQGGQITGTVTKAGGGILEGIGVSVSSLTGGYGYGGTTQSDGTYSVTVPAGNYKVSFWPHDGMYYVTQFYNNKTSWNAADTVGVNAGETHGGINAQMVMGGAIGGRVMSGVTPVQGVNVGAVDLNGNWIRSAQTNDQGYYTVYGVPAGTNHLKVNFTPPTSSFYLQQWYSGKSDFGLADKVPSVTVGVTTTGINADLVVGGKIQGMVTRDGTNGIGNVAVSVTDSPSYWLAGNPTDQSGNYSVTVPAGINLKLCFTPPPDSHYLSQWYNGKNSFANGYSTSVAPNGIVTLSNVTLTLGGAIVGRVTQGGVLGIPNIDIFVDDPADYHVIRSARTDGGGYYSVGGVSIGDYKILVQDSQSRYFVPQWYNRKSTPALADTITVHSDETVGVNPDLVAGGAVSGHIENESHQSVQSVDVQVRDLSNNFIWSVQTRGDGNYYIPVAAGTYKVYFNTSMVPQYTEEWYDNAADFSHASPITVNNGAPNNLNIVTLSLKPTSITISGTITVGGNGLAGVVMNGLPGPPTTSGSGFYTATVSAPFTGTVTPTANGYSFTPPSTAYTNVATPQVTNYSAAVTAFILSLNRGGTGTGQVEVNGVLRNLPYAESFTPGTLINLRAAPATGSMFTEWTHDLGGMTNPTSILMNGHKNVWANFMPSGSSMLAYITNSGSHNVSVIDTSTNSVVGTPIPTGQNPHGVAVAPGRIYTANRGSGTVTVIDMGTNYPIGTVSVGSDPTGICVNNNGSRVYVTNRGSNTVSVIDTLTNTEILPPITVGNTPEGIALNPAGTFLYVTNNNSNDVSVISTSTNAVVATISVGTYPVGVTVNPSGDRVYVANRDSNNLSVINAATNTEITKITLGANVENVVLNPDGTRAYVVNQGSGNVSVVDTANNTELLPRIPVGSTPWGIAINTTGARLYVANTGSNTVTVIDASTNAVISTLNVGTGPVGFGRFIGVYIPPSYPIWGHVKVNGLALSGVVMNGVPEPPTTDDSGYYTAMVPAGWSGTVTPSKSGGYEFVPNARTYSNVNNAMPDQDYSAGIVGVGYRVVFDPQPTNAIVNSVFSPAITVKFQDILGNDASSYSGTVTLAIASNPGFGNLHGTISKTGTGTVTFDDVSVDSVADGYSLTATSGSLQWATSAFFNITAPPNFSPNEMNEGVAPNGFGSTGSLYQTFKPSTSRLAAVRLRFGAGAGLETGTNTTIRLRQDSYTGAVLGTATSYVSPKTYGEEFTVTYYFPAALSLTPESTYVIELAGNPGGVMMWSATSSDTYARGQALTTSGTPYSPPIDFIFTTYSNGVLVGYTVCGIVSVGGVPLPGVTMTGLYGTPTPTTDASGFYYTEVPAGWMAVVTPTLSGYAFSPISTTYPPVNSNQRTSYTATAAVNYTISGTITLGGNPLLGVMMNGLPGSPSTNASGFYTATVPSGWSNTVTPTLAGYTFTNPSTFYPSVTSSQTTDYTATAITYTISGYITVGSSVGPPLAGVTMSGLPGSPTTNASGGYSGTVNYGWSGTVTPTLAGYSFNPLNQPYSSVTSDQMMNYIATALSYTLTISKIGTGAGTVTSSPSGINCGSTCSAAFAPGTAVALTAMPGIGHKFSGWSGLYVPEGHTMDNPLTITVDENKTITANFEYIVNEPILWYNGTGSTGDWANSVVTDVNLNAYVTGTAGNDFRTNKFNSSKALEWGTSYNYNTVTPGFDEATAIAVDAQGNAYMTGYGTGAADHGLDFVTIKQSGWSPAWVATYDSASNMDDRASAIAVDASGNVYVTGDSRNKGNITTIKYDSQGNQLWVVNKARTMPTGGKAIALDQAGNVYVCACEETVGIANYVLIKYGPKGNEIWSYVYGSVRRTSATGAFMAVDSDGIVFLTGTTLDGNMTTIKFQANGVPDWAMGSPGSGVAIAVMDGTAVISAGMNSFGDVLVWKYEYNDHLLLNKTLFPSALYSTTFALRAMTIDPLGNIYLTGTGNNDFRTAKLDISGNVVWAGTNGASGTDVPHDLALDAVGNLYVAGYYDDGGSAHEDYVLMRFLQSFPDKLVIATPALENGITNVPYAKAVWAFGGSGTRTWSVTGGSLPPGLSLNSSTGVVSGTPTANGSYGFTIQAVNGSLTASKTFYLAIQDPYVYVSQWGSSGTGFGYFDHPFGIAVDGSANVFVADTHNHRIQKFTSNGSFTTAWGAQGTGDGLFGGPSDGPYGIAVDGSGFVYVADTVNHRIEKFSSGGTFQGWWGGDNMGGTGWHNPGSGLTGISGTGDGQLNTPRGIAVDGSGNVYVSDSNNNRIQKFSSAGGFIAKWGGQGNGNGQFNSPWGIAVDGTGNVYVSDSSNHRIQEFDSAGGFIRTWGTNGSGDGQFSSPAGIGIDPSGFVFVVDYGNSRIQVFSPIGSFRAKWGSVGSGNGQFLYPSGIAVDGNGYIYVTDTNNFRVQRFI